MQLYIPNLTDQLAQIGSGSDQLRDRRARRRVHGLSRGHGRSRIPEGPGVGAGVVHLEPLLRQLRPGQFHDRDRTTRTSSSARRTSATARAASCGTTSSACCAAIGPNAFKIYGAYYLPGTRRSAPSPSRSRAQPWEEHSYLPYIALTTNTSDTDRYAEPAGSHRSVARAARPELHAGAAVPQALQGRGRRPTSSTSSTARPATTSSRTSAPLTSACRGPSTIRGGWS